MTPRHPPAPLWLAPVAIALSLLASKREGSDDARDAVLAYVDAPANSPARATAATASNTCSTLSSPAPPTRSAPP